MDIQVFACRQEFRLVNLFLGLPTSFGRASSFAWLADIGSALTRDESMTQAPCSSRTHRIASDCFGSDRLESHQIKSESKAASRNDLSTLGYEFVSMIISRSPLDSLTCSAWVHHMSSISGCGGIKPKNYIKLKPDII